MTDPIGTTIGVVGAIAAIGAWSAAWYPNRFTRSWLIEPRENPGQFLVRNNTRRRAVIITVEATPLYPDRPNEQPLLHVDAPAQARLEQGEAFAIRTRAARGVVISWGRERWWLPRKNREYSGEWTIPIKYS